MPNLTTHIHFALLFFERARYTIYLPALIEGAVAPGIRLGQDTFTNSHSIGAGNDISREESITGSFSYRLGYLSHSFLDHYFDAYRADIFLFQSPSKEERMRRISMAEQIDTMHMKEYKAGLQSLSEKYGEAFTNLYHTASEDNCMEIARDYENLMIEIVGKFTPFLEALKCTPASDDFIP